MKRFYFVAVFLFSALFASSQSNWKIINDTRDIFKIIPDGQKIWMASDGGLMCINKSTSDTTFYNHANSGIPFTEISDMYLDINGRLWLTSLRAGIACKDGDNWIAYNASDSSLPNNIAVAITGDNYGNIWACIRDYLVKISGASRLYYATDSLGIPWSYDTKMTMDKNGRILIGNYGLYAFNGDTIVRYDTSNSTLKEASIISMKTFPDGKTWIGQQNSGITVTDFNTWNHYDSLVSNIPLSSVTSFDITPEGHYWLGTYSGDIYTHNGQEWSLIIPDPPVDSILYIQTLAVDEDNHLYIAGYEDILYDGANWNKINTAAYLFHGNSVNDIIHTTDGATWIANYYGMTKIINYSFINYHYDDEPDNYYISALCFAEDNAGKLFVGHTDGVSYFENESWHRVHIPLSGLFSSIYPRSMCFDAENNLWIATFPGLVKYDGINSTLFSPYYSNFPVDEIYKLSLDQNGFIMAGTAHGLVQWDGIVWHQYTDMPNPGDNNQIWDLTVKGEDIWMGTSDGLIRFDGTNWEAFTPDNSPLPYRFVPTLDFDTGSTLWMISGQNNLCSFDGQNWQVFDFYNSGILWGPNRILRIDNNKNKWTGGFNSAISIYNEEGVILEIPKIEKNEMRNNQIISVFPNPASDEIKICYQLPQDVETAKLLITNIQGKIIEVIPLSKNRKNIDYLVGRLTPGQYLFTLDYGMSLKKSQKIVVIH